MNQTKQVENSNTTGPSDTDLMATEFAAIRDAATAVAEIATLIAASKPQEPTLLELVGQFCADMDAARRLYRTASTPDAFWEQDGRIDATTALQIGREANIDTARRVLVCAEKRVAAMAERGLPETLRHRCERALRSCDQSDESWAQTENLLEAWATETAKAAKALPVAPETPGRHRAKRRLTRKPLTKPQTDALEVYIRCNRNVGATAVELGISRPATYDRINAALKKTGGKPLASRAGKSVRAHAMG